MKRFLLALLLVLAPVTAWAGCSVGVPGTGKIVTGTSYTIGQLDGCNGLVFTSGSSIAVSLPAPGTQGGFQQDFNVFVYAQGAGAVTVTPSAPVVGGGAAPTINGGSTLVINGGSAAQIRQDSAGNWIGLYSKASGSSGTTPVANGGTGLTSGTSGGILGFTASGTIASSAALTLNGFVIGGGAGATPTALAACTAGQLPYGSAGAPACGTPAFAMTKPSNQSAISSATAVMLGLGGATNPATLTPVTTGRIEYAITGTVTANTSGASAAITCSHGTGTAPANAAALTGTQDSAALTFTNAASTTEKVPFSCNGVLSGLALSTAVWFDLAVSITSGTTTITAATFTANEF